MLIVSPEGAKTTPKRSSEYDTTAFNGEAPELGSVE